MPNSTYFYEQAGLSSSNAFTFTLVQYFMGLVGTVISWWLTTKFGRRTLYISGMWALIVLLVIIGGLGFSSSTSAQWAVGSLLLVFTLAYNLSVGPVCYAIVAEVSSTRLRQKTVVLARMAYNCCSLLNNSLLPLQLNPTAWGWGAKAGLFWAGITALCIVWSVFRLPETGGRSYAELTLLFENHVPAWKFKGTKVDAFRSESFRVERIPSDSEATEVGAATEERIEKA
jgi:MFS transporter, SP family, general alpha glucoside:H+ symporter